MPFKSHSRFTVFMCGYIFFLCIAASVFMAVEQEEELNRLKVHQKVRDDFIAKYPCVNLVDLASLIEYFAVESKNGISVTDNTTNWYFGQSVFFVTTIVTTIGYGHITPMTSAGKVFSVIFATVGLPFTLSVMSAFVDRLLIPTTLILHWMQIKYRPSYRMFTIQIFHLLLVTCAVFALFLLLPAAVFNKIEPDWSFFDSCYYCFMSLTSIGFGDFTPGEGSALTDYRTAYKLITSVYLFFGMIFMMLTLAVFYEIPQINLDLLYTIQGADMPINDEVEIGVVVNATESYKAEQKATKKKVTTNLNKL